MFWSLQNQNNGAPARAARSAFKLLTKDEARRIAAIVEALGKGGVASHSS
jgi:hypothetical protein